MSRYFYKRDHRIDIVGAKNRLVSRRLGIHSGLLAIEIVELNGRLDYYRTEHLSRRTLDAAAFQFTNPPDLNNFRGVFKVTASSGQIAATVLRQTLPTQDEPADLATSPVTRPR